MAVDPSLQGLGVNMTHYTFAPTTFDTSYPVYGANNGSLDGSMDGNPPYVQEGGYFQTIPQDEARQQRPQPQQQSPQRAQRRQPNTQNVTRISNLSSMPQLQATPTRNSFPTPYSKSTGNKDVPVDMIRTNKPNHLRPQSTISRSTTTSDSLPTPPHDHHHHHRHQSQQTSPKVIADPTAFTPPHLARPLIPNPPHLAEWRQKFFNISSPLLLTSEEYHTYFPHIDNVYSHRSTQKYKKKPFVSHYWDCRLKGRPTGTPINKKKTRQNANAEDEGERDNGDDLNNNSPEDAGGADNNTGKERKKRKRKTRERDLCDVKIKVTEFFGRDELEALGKMNQDDGRQGGDEQQQQQTTSQHTGLTFVMEDVLNPSPAGLGNGGIADLTSMPFGVLEPPKDFPVGHPGAEGKRWYMVQRVTGSGRDGEGETGGGSMNANHAHPHPHNHAHAHQHDHALDHKHTLEESDRIKKNSVQRWLLAQEKENKRKQGKTKASESSLKSPSISVMAAANPPFFHASGRAEQTLKSHSMPSASHITYYGNSFCPFSQRVWIALELKGIPYQYVEVTETSAPEGKCTIPALLKVNPTGETPCVRHGNFAVWESNVIMEYLEDLTMGISLLPVGNAQLRAHSRLWTDHINRKILPAFYSLLLTPQSEVVDDHRYKPGVPPLSERRSVLINTLQEGITSLVNASHQTGPFFLGDQVSYVDVSFAPWIIRLSRVLSFYRDFPRPEVGTRWQMWVDAIEFHEGIQRTVSEDRSYHNIYGGVGDDGFDGSLQSRKPFAEINYAKRVVRQEGFGLGGDLWGHLRA